MALSASPFPKSLLLSHQKCCFLFPQTLVQGKLKPLRTKYLARALKEWQEYEDAVKRKDLARALRFLKNKNDNNPIEPLSDSLMGESNRARLPEFVGGFDRDWEVLDTCLNADDLKLVASAYKFLQNRGFLPSFGKFNRIVLEGPRDVTPTVLKSSTGLEASKLSPKKWGVSGSSRVALVAFLGGTSFLLSQGIDIRPNLAVILGLALVDAIFLGGVCLAQISSYWPPYKRRILVHEAGHLLIGCWDAIVSPRNRSVLRMVFDKNVKSTYLMGCPIRGVILDPIVAMQMGIQGQAGTQFWDEKMNNELAEGRLSGTAFDRYSMVLFAGIAAEALIYGEAEGGENDENLFRSICVLLQPPLSMAQMSNQARWAVLQSYNLLKWHKHAHLEAVKALESGSSLSVVIRRIEEAMSSST
ncbi:ATP-dependent zinc metalloprotease [Citrus sinensis]|uniref:ATP-dependent zinc metalloprotease n=1 Tax=Citrus sinensis TaxID=2711 RepID=A0ACB8HQL6_CITSI|nr:ATP-dependent zinc metalloprotease [Citrus sinensis]